MRRSSGRSHPKIEFLSGQSRLDGERLILLPVPDAVGPQEQLARFSCSRCGPLVIRVNPGLLSSCKTRLHSSLQSAFLEDNRVCRGVPPRSESSTGQWARTAYSRRKPCCSGDGLNAAGPGKFNVCSWSRQSAARRRGGRNVGRQKVVAPMRT